MSRKTRKTGIGSGKDNHMFGIPKSKEHIEKIRKTIARKYEVAIKLELEQGLKVCNKCNIALRVRLFPYLKNPSKYGSKVIGTCKLCISKRVKINYRKKQNKL